MSLAVLFHASAIWIAAWAAPPSSPLQQGLHEAFGWYYGLIDQGSSYRYYSPEPPPAPVISAVLSYRDGHEETVRLPGLATRPRFLYQRELALANHLSEDVELARRATGDPGRSVLAEAYAKHLGKTHPETRSVRLSVQVGIIPDPRHVLGPTAPGRGEGSAGYSTPERIGDFPCVP